MRVHQKFDSDSNREVMIQQVDLDPSDQAEISLYYEYNGSRLYEKISEFGIEICDEFWLPIPINLKDLV